MNHRTAFLREHRYELASAEYNSWLQHKRAAATLSVFDMQYPEVISQIRAERNAARNAGDEKAVANLSDLILGL